MMAAEKISHPASVAGITDTLARLLSEGDFKYAYQGAGLSTG